MDMSDEEPPSTFDECESEEDARELIAQRYNNTVVEAMDEGFGPMFTAREFRDHAGATVVALHSTSVREQMDEGDEDHGGVLDGGSHPLQ